MVIMNSTREYYLLGEKVEESAQSVENINGGALSYVKFFFQFCSNFKISKQWNNYFSEMKSISTNNINYLITIFILVHNYFIILLFIFFGEVF